MHHRNTLYTVCTYVSYPYQQCMEGEWRTTTLTDKAETEENQWTHHRETHCKSKIRVELGFCLTRVWWMVGVHFGPWSLRSWDQTGHPIRSLIKDRSDQRLKWPRTEVDVILTNSLWRLHSHVILTCDECTMWQVHCNPCLLYTSDAPTNREV